MCAFHELMSLKGIHIPFQQLQILQKEQSPGNRKRNLLCQISQLGEADILLFIDFKWMIPILIQFYNRKKNERTSRNEQNTYSVGTKYYFSSWDQIIVKDEVLYKCCTTTLGSTIEQPIVPEVMNNILNMCHCSLLSKHLGIKKTKVRFTRNFYWFALREDI